MSSRRNGTCPQRDLARSHVYSGFVHDQKLEISVQQLEAKLVYTAEQHATTKGRGCHTHTHTRAHVYRRLSSHGAGGRQRAPRCLTPAQWGTHSAASSRTTPAGGRGHEGPRLPQTAAERRGAATGCSRLSVTAQTVHLNARTRKTVKITDGGPDVTGGQEEGRGGDGDGDRSAALQQALVRLWAPARHVSGTHPGAEAARPGPSRSPPHKRFDPAV